MTGRANNGAALTRRAVAAGLAAGVAAPTKAVAQDAALIEAAKKEGEVVWYTGLIVNQVVRPLIEAFEKKYGVRVRMTSVGMQSELVLKVGNEMRSGRPVADVIEGGGQMIPPLVAAGAIEAYKPASTATYRPDFKSADGLWTVTSVNYLTAAINTELVKPGDAPKTYQDLLDPKWRGNMVWSSDLNAAGAPGFIGNILMSMGEAAGLDYLKKLVAQKITPLGVNQRVVLDQVIAGQYPLALTTFYHHGVISRAQGAPTQWIPLEPIIAVGNVSALVKNAPHPNAGRLLLEFLFSEEGQAVFRDANYVPAHPDVASKLPPVRADGAPFKSQLIGPEMSAENLPRWTKLYQEMFA